jgi:hypothetical protein
MLYVVAREDMLARFGYVVAKLRGERDRQNVAGREGVISTGWISRNAVSI